jgi:hypothetical protein
LKKYIFLNVTLETGKVEWLYACIVLRGFHFFNGVNTFSASYEVHVFASFRHDGSRVRNSLEVWILFQLLCVMSCDGVSCTWWPSFREVSLLLHIQKIYWNVSEARRHKLWQGKNKSLLYQRTHFWGQNIL